MTNKKGRTVHMLIGNHFGKRKPEWNFFIKSYESFKYGWSLRLMKILTISMLTQVILLSPVIYWIYQNYAVIEKLLPVQYNLQENIQFEKKWIVFLVFGAAFPVEPLVCPEPRPESAPPSDVLRLSPPGPARPVPLAPDVPNVEPELEAASDVSPVPTAAFSSSISARNLGLFTEFIDRVVMSSACIPVAMISAMAANCFAVSLHFKFP